jgi:hypothetical protein
MQVQELVCPHADEQQASHPASLVKQVALLPSWAGGATRANAINGPCPSITTKSTAEMSLRFTLRAYHR